MTCDSQTPNRVLFSAIGDTDPMSSDKDGLYFDGSMLHIVRHYKPKKVYLILSAEMSKRDKDTDIYAKAIHLVSPDCLVDKTYTDIVNAHDFDAFYDIFSNILNRIENENQGAEILLNVSSGTPQMKTTLCLEAVSRNTPLTAIQVSSPANRTNTDMSHFNPYKDDLTKAAENLYDKINDNGETPESRCKEDLSLIGFRKGIIKNQVKGSIASGEYKAAYDIISNKNNEGLFTERLRLLVKHAYYRFLPEVKEAEGAARELKMLEELYPVKKGAAKLTCEYFLAAILRKDRGELTDFTLRAMALTEHLAQAYLEEILEDGIESIAYKSNNGYKLAAGKAERNLPGLMAHLNKAYKDKGGYHIDNIITLNTMELILIFIHKHTNFGKLFDVREDRNQAAHRLESVTEYTFKALGTSKDDLQETLKWLIVRIYGSETKKAFEVFTLINKMISEELDKDTKTGDRPL